MRVDSSDDDYFAWTRAPSVRDMLNLAPLAKASDTSCPPKSTAPNSEDDNEVASLRLPSERARVKRDKG